MGVCVLVLLLKIIQNWHRLGFARKKIQKNIGVFLKIAHLIDDTSGKYHQWNKGGAVLVFEKFQI